MSHFRLFDDRRSTCCNPVRGRACVEHCRCRVASVGRFVAFGLCLLTVGANRFGVAPGSNDAAVASVQMQPMSVNPDEPLPERWGVITGEEVLVRPGAGYMYEVGRVQRGDLVRILQETVDGFILISPPIGVKGFIETNPFTPIG
ncbi:MAG: hypothetical protein ACOC0P_07840, partial [Planctomycetota bacterium]